MRVIRYWPVGSDMKSYTEWLRNEMNRLFESEGAGSPAGLFDRAVSPPIDVVEADDAYHVSVDLPGVKEQEIELSVTNNVLTLSGEKHLPGFVGNGTGNEKEGSGSIEKRIFRNETWSGTFQRTISFERPIDSEGITAALSDGILRIHVPVSNEARTRKITVGT